MFFQNSTNLLVRFDENTDTDQLFVWNKVQVKNNKLQDFKELFLQKREQVIKILKTYQISEIIPSYFF